MMNKFYKLLFITAGLLLSCSLESFSQTERMKYLSYVFPSDSLAGFNEIQANNTALNEGFFGKEYKVFMYKAKRDYINAKYHIIPDVFDPFTAKGNLPSPAPLGAPCVNEDFELNNLSGWTVTSRNVNSNSCTNQAMTSSGSPEALVVTTPLADPYFGTIPNSPLGGTRVAKLNNNAPTGLVTRISQTFPVNANNALFQYAYLAVFQGAHACCSNPFLNIFLKNCSNVLIACPQVTVVAAGTGCTSGSTGFTPPNASGISWNTAWQVRSLDLTPYIGSCITVEVTVGDCTAQGHFGYAYFDALCSPMNLIVNNVPFPVGTSATTITACGATNATVTAPPGLAPYTWNGPPGSGVTNNPNQTFTSSVSGNYTLTVNPLGSCAPTTRTVNLQFVANPTAGITTANVCNNYTITNTGSAAPSVQSYSFNGPAAIPSFTSNVANNPITFPTPGTYTIYQTVTNTSSCTATASQIINVITGPNPAFTTPNYTQCLLGNSFTFNATIATGTHTFDFNPTVGAPPTGNVNNYGPVSFSAPGTYTVIHTITDAGCTAFTSSVVVLNPMPTVTANNNGPICIGGNAAFTGSGGGTYNWTGPNGFNSAVQNPTITGVTIANGGTYTLSVNLNGCLGSATTTLVISTPTASASNTGPYCAGQTILLNGSSGTTYTWTGPSGFNSNLQNPSISNSLPSMTGTYSFVVNLGGCFAGGTTNVVVNPNPVPTINHNGPLCIGNDLLLTGNGGANYAWQGPNGFVSTIQNPTIIAATPMNSGTYTLIVTDANSCFDVTTANIIVNPQPIIAAAGSTVCENSNATLTSSGGATYNWSGPNGFNSTVQNPIIPGATLLEVGQYTVIVTDANTCTNTAVVNIGVNPAPIPLIVTNSPICINSILNLTAVGGVSYSWTGPNGFISSVQNPTLNANTTAYSGNYQVTVTDGNGCTASTNTNAIINPNPVPAITSGPNAGCAPLCVQFTVSSTPAVATANWTLGDGKNVNGTLTANSCYDVTGIYTITAVVTDLNGCVGVATYTAEVYPKPVADFNHSPIKPIINIDGDVVFTDASYGANITSWNWYFMNTPQYTSNIQNPTFVYTESGTYAVALVVKSDKGCTDTIVRPLVVGEDFGIYVPNAFTPNGDGLNELFQPKGFGIVKYNLKIFDRWGEKIFETSTFEEGWDGTYQTRGDKIIQNGVYTWLIEVTSVFGKAHELKGHVTLIK